MPPNFKPIERQVMVITGASSGIGLATARTAADLGARLVLVARNEQALATIVRQLEAAGATACHVVADVGDSRQVQRVAETAAMRYGGIDTWVNNAGVTIYGWLEAISEGDSRRLFATNFWGVVNGSLAALPYLKEQGGTLINVGSELSDAVIPLQGMCAASKHAVKGFTDALRLELELNGAPVSVSLIQPAAVNTPYPQHARNYMDREPKLTAPQLDPQEVADAIIDAATHQRRDVTVGMMAAIHTTIAKVAPSLGDWMAGRQLHRQQREERPWHPAGALYAPCEAGSVHGERSALTPRPAPERGGRAISRR